MLSSGMLQQGDDDFDDDDDVEGIWGYPIVWGNSSQKNREIRQATCSSCLRRPYP